MELRTCIYADKSIVPELDAVAALDTLIYLFFLGLRITCSDLNLSFAYGYDFTSKVDTNSFATDTLIAEFFH